MEKKNGVVEKYYDNGKLKSVVIKHKDRLTRFQF